MIEATNKSNQPSASKPSFNISRRINVCKTASPANTSVSALASRVVYSTAILLLLVAPLGKYIIFVRCKIKVGLAYIFIIFHMKYCA